MYDYNFVHLFSYSAALKAPPQSIGLVPEGIRVTFHILGGPVEGERLKGRMLGEGADWFLMRPDGIGELDVRGAIETSDGALIYIHYLGLGDFGEDGYAKLARGELPRKVTLRTTPVLRTAHPDYQWLHRLNCIGVGEADLERFTASYDVYAVR